MLSTATARTSAAHVVRRLHNSAASVPLLRRAAEHGDRLAVSTHDGTQFTYKNLLQASGRFATDIVANKDDINHSRVAFMCPPGPSYIVAKWAAWAAGGIAVPLHPGHPDAEVEYVLSDAQPSTLICHSDFFERVEPIARGLGLHCHPISDVDADTRNEIDMVIPTGLTENRDANDWVDSAFAKRAALMIYTSGTTGRPKGAVHTHGGLTAQIKSLTEAWDYTPTDRILHFLPLHHTHGIVNKLLCPLWAGACVEFAPNAKADTLTSLLAQSTTRPSAEQLTLFMAVPTIYALLIKHLKQCPATERATAIEGIKQLRLMVSGSAACPVPVMTEWEAITGHRLLERYGMTEIGMALSNKLHGTRFPGYVGRPLPGVSARLVDEETEDVLFQINDKGDFDPADLGGGEEVTGLLEVNGPTIFVEYWGKPDATAKEFTTDGWFRTGDVATYSRYPGALKICGRASVDIIKSGGYKVSALDVERAVLESPLVEQTAVLGIADHVWGEKIAAIVVLSPEGIAMGADDAIDTIKKKLDQDIADYKVPRVWLVQQDIPKNAMGKVNKKSLIQLFEDLI